MDLELFCGVLLYGQIKSPSTVHQSADSSTMVCLAQLMRSIKQQPKFQIPTRVLSDQLIVERLPGLVLQRFSPTVVVVGLFAGFLCTGGAGGQFNIKSYF